MKATVVITGIAGNLGQRLLPMLSGYQVIGIDLKPPQSGGSLSRFIPMDLGLEKSCREFFLLVKEVRPVAVIHLAFVLDPVRNDVLDLDQMWQINVAGTARVMEAITEANRDEPLVSKFIMPSSVAAYGPDLPQAVNEEFPLAAHTLPYAIHKMEADKVVQQRAPALRGCSVYMLRPHIFTGATVENYMVGAFRGAPNGKGKSAARMRQDGKRLPCMLPMGKKYLDNRIQFVHIDDMARLIVHILDKNEPESQRLTILNVAGRGEPMTFAQCIGLANAKLIRVPSRGIFRMVLSYLWKRKISAIPPDAAPYMMGEYIMNTDRLRKFLGRDYEEVIRYTIADAFADSFATKPAVQAQHSIAAQSS